MAKEGLAEINNFLDKVDSLNIFSVDPKSGKEDKSVMSETDTTSMLDPPPAKMAKFEEEEEEEDPLDLKSEDVEFIWDSVAQRCIKNLERWDKIY